MQAYSDPERANDPHALPDIEVFYISDADQQNSVDSGYVFLDDEGEPLEEGWYWWSCFPGCLPDSPPFGPYDSEAEALADAQERD